jgi:hypothetical protein
MDDFSKQILNDIETDKVIAFKSDPVAFNAVKKYVLAVAYKHGVVRPGEKHVGNLNFALNLAGSAIHPNGEARSDEELGQNLRALAYAVQLVESGFKEMSDMEKPEEEKKELPVNEAE